MKATETNLLAFLKKASQFVIPIYQRTYSWTEKECRRLWDDILRTGSSDDIAAHFVGSIVYIDQGPYQVTGPFAAARHRRPAAPDDRYAHYRGPRKARGGQGARGRIFGEEAPQLLSP